MGVSVIDVGDFRREVLESTTPVFVKFGATWCGPCKAMAPIVDAMAEEYGDEVKFVDVDLDQSGELAAEQGVRGVPTFLIVRRGKIVDRAVGAQSRTRIAAMLEAGIEA